MDIMEHIEHSVPVATQGFIGIHSKEGVLCYKIRMCTMRQPTNGSNDALVFLFAFNQSRIFVVFVKFLNCINCEAGMLRCGIRCDVPLVNVILFNKMSSKTYLMQVGRYFVR
jgi:hypothetical protein